MSDRYFKGKDHDRDYFWKWDGETLWVLHPMDDQWYPSVYKDPKDLTGTMGWPNPVTEILKVNEP